MTYAIYTEQLTKHFPPSIGLGRLLRPFPTREGTLAVDRVSLQIRPGEIFGLVGPNGAGKTTLVKLLCTLILPNAGAAYIHGHPLADEYAVKASIGLMTCNERSFYPRLRCRENLSFYAGLHDLSAPETAERIAALSDLLGLGEFLEKRYDACSTGMKHRLALARSLLHNPPVLFLDEPTRSLDPLAAERFREALLLLARREGRTVFLVTHDLEEAVGLCDRVGVMLRGQVKQVDDPARLRALLRASGTCRLQIAGMDTALSQALAALPEVRALKSGATVGRLTDVSLELTERKGGLAAITKTIERRGGSVESLAFESLSWDEIFGQLPETSSKAAPSVPIQPAHPRPTERRRGGTLRKWGLFLKRDWQTQFSYRLSFVLQLFGILFSIASFYFVSQLFGAAANPYLSAYGGDYFSFVLIGIAFSNYQGVALHTFAGIIQSAQVMGTLEAMLTTPTRLPTLLTASSLWNFAFTSFRVVLYLLVGMLLFGAALPQANLGAGLLALLLTILSLSGIGILSASFIIVFKRGNPLNFFFGSLSSLLAGVYYPVEVLPEWLQWLARFFPLTYALQAMRKALLNGATLAALVQELSVLALFTAALLPLGLVTFRYAVRQAKRDGSLTQF